MRALAQAIGGRTAPGRELPEAGAKIGTGQDPVERQSDQGKDEREQLLLTFGMLKLTSLMFG